MLGKEPPSSPGEMRAKLKIIETGIADMAEDVHDMARLLHPPHLDDLGLVAAINMECTNFSMRNKIPIEFKPQHVPDSLSEDVSVNLYRIIQECLRNIVKHAEATEGSVTLLGSEDALLLSVTDSGKGFDPEQVKRESGLGLAGMEERVRLLGGVLSVESHPGRGTTIEVSVPLPRSDK